MTDQELDFKPGYQDGSGYWRSARSLCCGQWLVYFNTAVQTLVHWAGWEGFVPELYCRRCHREVSEVPYSG